MSAPPVVGPDGTDGPETWFGGVPRVLFVHAHPDDETITTGGTLAGLAAAGREPLLVTLTRGERGEVVPGPMQALVAAHGLAVVRQRELAEALAALGVERHAFLGVPPARAEGQDPAIYEDSGMSWGADGRATAAADASPDALTSVPAVEALNDLLAAAYLSGAQALVSYDDGGGYGHPDHVLAHRLARAVAQALELPFWEIVADPDPDPAAALGIATDTETGTEIDTAADTAGIAEHAVDPWLDRKIAALRAYRTQLKVVPTEGSAGAADAATGAAVAATGAAVAPGDTPSWRIRHVGGQFQQIGRVERFRAREIAISTPSETPSAGQFPLLRQHAGPPCAPGC